MRDTKNIVSSRFKALLEGLKVNVPELAKRLGYDRYDKLYNIYNGKNLPSFEVLHDITKKFVHVNANWLLTGEGSMFQTENLSPSESKHQQTNPSIETQSSDNENFVPIPVVEISVAAGCSGYDNGGYVESINTLRLPSSMAKHNRTYFCVKIKGESMAPTLLDSGYVIIRLLDRGEWADMPEKHIYVISDRDGKSYIKRIKNRLRQHGFITCMSDNPDKANYPNFNIQEDEINTILYAEWYFTAKMPNIHEQYYNKVSELEDKMDVIQNQVGLIFKALQKQD